jgi:hypothetical protein
VVAAHAGESLEGIGADAAGRWVAQRQCRRDLPKMGGSRAMSDAGASVSASRVGSMTPAYCLPCFVVVFLLPRLFG